MTAAVLAGKEPAALWRAETAGRVGALATEGIKVGLATLLVGDDGPSQVYVSMKHKAATAAGMTSIDTRLDAESLRMSKQISSTPTSG